jgi:hypothetical protein
MSLEAGQRHFMRRHLPHRFRAVTCIALASAITLASAAAYAQTPTAPDTAVAPAADTTHHRHWWPSDFGLAVGPGIGWQRYADQVSGRETALTAVGGFYRGSKLGPESKAGFVPTFKVTLYPTKVAAVAADPSATVLGTIRLRPMMVGLGWFHPIGRAVSLRLTGLGGWSFNGLGAPEDPKRRPELQVSSAPTAVGSNVAWETSGKLWFNTSPNVAFITGVSFIHARPELTLADGSTRGWNADHVRVDAGVAFTVYRWHRGDAGK